jgi:hypothetical protein
MTSSEVEKYRLPSFRRKPESSRFKQLQTIWTPVFTGVTTFYEFIKVTPEKNKGLPRARWVRGEGEWRREEQKNQKVMP